MINKLEERYVIIAYYDIPFFLINHYPVSYVLSLYSAPLIHSIPLLSHISTPMTMRKLPLLLSALLLSGVMASAWDVNKKYTGPKTPTTDTTWHPDILPGYEARYVNQGEAFDGPCRSTIVRKLRKGGSRKAFLYVHGFNDYFFQAEMGERFVDSAMRSRSGSCLPPRLARRDGMHRNDACHHSGSMACILISERYKRRIP